MSCSAAHSPGDRPGHAPPESAAPGDAVPENAAPGNPPAGNAPSAASTGTEPRPAPEPASLAARVPSAGVDRLIAELVPPPRFGTASFATYAPDPGAPGQAAAVQALTDFAAQIGEAGAGRSGRSKRRRWFPARAAPRPVPGPGPGPCPGPGPGPGPGGVYLDGGFGVGKTHLLAALWHAAPVPAEAKAFCTFSELTHLVGALGFQETVRALGGHHLLCVDEFELDDPGDTVLVSSLLARLGDAGVALAATSNTLPGRLGEGRFAAEDFLREIQGLAARFTTLRIDGPDYRHRGPEPSPAPLSPEQVARAARTVPGATLDDFPRLLDHLAHVHPSRYGALLDEVAAVCLTGVRPVTDQAPALRLVVLADRMYDQAVPLYASGERLESLFGDQMLAGGYRKKYLRALSRLTALSREARRTAVPAVPSARRPA